MLAAAYAGQWPANIQVTTVTAQYTMEWTDCAVGAFMTVSMDESKCILWYQMNYCC